MLTQSPTAVYSLGVQQQLFINHHSCLPRHGRGPSHSITDYHFHCTDPCPVAPPDVKPYYTILPTLVPVVYYDTDSSISLVFYKHPTDSYFG